MPVVSKTAEPLCKAVPYSGICGRKEGVLWDELYYRVNSKWAVEVAHSFPPSHNFFRHIECVSASFSINSNCRSLKCEKLFSRKSSDKTASKWCHRLEPIKYKPESLVSHDSTIIERQSNHSRTNTSFLSTTAARVRLFQSNLQVNSKEFPKTIGRPLNFLTGFEFIWSSADLSFLEIP
jgi:hypothetical protein